MAFRWPGRPKAPTPAKWGLPPARARERTRSWLAAIAVGTVIAWQVPFGAQVLYPFSLLATWFHEMGHGLTSMLLGARFERLVLFADGSGFAQSAWRGDAPALFHALTAAGGLIAPALVGAGLIVASRSERATRYALLALGGLLLVSTIVWVRSLAGWIVLPLLGAASIAIAWKGSERARRFAVEFLGVQAAISIWRDLGYMFSPGGVVGGVAAPSDTAVIADVLVLPYWFWGAAISAATVALVWKALVRANAP